MRKIYTKTVFVIALNVLLGISVAPLGSTTNDDYIRQKIENAAGENSSLKNGADVGIAVERGYVVLYGTVGRYIQKMLYEKIAWKTDGVLEVENEIRVVPEFPKTDAAIDVE